ncbi:MAG TPA: M56 family metallopeptidase [Sphingomonadaceae bacterium]|nr:M56 family metallopeptidase [Sphingomonadaceae bacterium]
MIAWLTDTLIYTGLLIAAVLLLRRPVARHFGAQAAYALWALPLLRFVMPPVVLPAEFAPEAASEAVVVYATPVRAVEAVSAAPAMSDAPVAATPLPVEPGFDLSQFLADYAFPIWIAGALVFLAWRGWSYFGMREDLLKGSRPVGEAGKVRLVETPAVSAPVAFGVTDKVVALPMEFMARENLHARDLAIEHELAHHRGGDLLANMLAQPVLALHWFNPLAWMGWRAMRRDQEAACDARVVARRDPAERAAYGQVIASFAAGPRLALAAPMACPVLGDKSIIHRLRSLTMSEVSPRRRFAGRALLAGAALVVPLTASISYAEAQIAPPEPPAAPAAPAAPDAPDAPPAPDAPEFAWTDDDEVQVEVRREGDREVTIIRKIVKDGEAPEDGEHKVVRRFTLHREAPMSDAARGEEGEHRFAYAFAPEDFEFDFDFEEFEKLEQLEQLEHPNLMVHSSADCKEGDGPVREEEVTENGKVVKRIIICQRAVQAQAQRAMGQAREAMARAQEARTVALKSRSNARAALVRAREEVRRDRELPQETREEIIDSLNEEIERLSDEVSALDQAAPKFQVRAVSARVGANAAECTATDKRGRVIA